MLRLSQDATAGFEPQVWDLLGNEHNFLLRDTTHGNRLPFRVAVGAPTHSLLVEPNGNVGVGAKVTTDATPAAVPTPSSLYVYRADGTAKLMVEEGNATRGARVLGQLQNDGPAQLQFTDASADPMTWLAGNGDGHDFALRPGTLSSTPVLTVSPTGDTRAGGAFEQRLDGQTDVGAVDPQRVLAGIKAVPQFSSWRYAGDPTGTAHLGPSAADFRAATGAGPAGNVLSTGDVAAAALIGVRALADIPPGSDPRVTPLVVDVAALKTRGTTYLHRIKVLESGQKKLTSANKKLTSSNKKMAKTLAALQKQVKALARRH